MATHSNVSPHVTKLQQLCYEMGQEMQNYVRIDPETDVKHLKIVFLGINQYQNGIPSFINWDLIYVYRHLQEAGAEARIHDPHIRPSEALSMGLWLGRQSEDDNWSHSFDVMILSCPHLFYMQNMAKLGNLCNPDKACLLLDMWGAFTRIYKVGNHISVINFADRVRVSGMLGGLTPRIIRGQIPPETK